MDKITITPLNLEHAKAWNENQFIKGYIIGSNRFGLRQITDFNLEMIKELREMTDKIIFVNVTKIIHNHELAELKQYLKELVAIGIDYIIFSDFAVYNLIKELELDVKTIYSTETTITNNSFTEFAHQIGVTGVDLAKEITYDEIKEIADNKQSEVMINLHSHIYMYQSVRKLITNYQTVQKATYEENRDYYLYDSERNNYYPLVENEQGTHLLASNDLCMINHLDKIEKLMVDYLIINGFGYSKSAYDIIIEKYIAAFTQLENDQAAYIANKREYLKAVKALVPHKKMGTGFYFKKTIY